MRLLVLAVLAVAGVVLIASPAGAQPFGPRAAPFTRTPTVSPYLNLLRGQGLPAVNYYGIVRPQMDAYARFQALGQGLQSAAAPPQPDAQSIPTTGLSAGFMNHGGYFLTTGGGSAVARPTRPAIGGAFGNPSAMGTVGSPAPVRAPRPAFR
jgi:hypothetical protein